MRSPCRPKYRIGVDVQSTSVRHPREYVTQSVCKVEQTAKAVKKAGGCPAAKHVELEKGACQTSSHDKCRTDFASDCLVS